MPSLKVTHRVPSSDCLLAAQHVHTASQELLNCQLDIQQTTGIVWKLDWNFFVSNHIVQRAVKSQKGPGKGSHEGAPAIAAVVASAEVRSSSSRRLEALAHTLIPM
jgi:hypothetical protein